MATPLKLALLFALALPASAAVRHQMYPVSTEKPCFVVGDSIAYGVSLRLPECVHVAKKGINTKDALSRFTAMPFNSKVVVISLGSNDVGTKLNTEEDVREMRRRAPKGAMVLWLLPVNKVKKDAVQKVANEFRDMTISFTPSKDHVHPTPDTYNQLGLTIRTLL